MIYFKNKNSDVYAYPKSDLTQVDRISELDLLLQAETPLFTDANDKLQKAIFELECAQTSLNELMSRKASEDDSEISAGYDEEIEKLTLFVTQKEKEHNDALDSFNNEKSIYQPLKDEYDAILPVFFGIRDQLKVLKKMTPKEVDLYLNPPISKEELIAEAEQQK
ncbi:hypothetical protein ACY2L5_001123 [Providencia rettgeri]